MTPDRFRSRMTLLLTVLILPFLVWTGFTLVRRAPGTLPVARQSLSADDGFPVATRLPDTTDDLCVPLPPDAHYEDVTFENRYAEHLLCITIRSARDDFYKTAPVFCREDLVSSVRCASAGENTITLFVETVTTLDCDLRIEDDTVLATLYRPAERFSRIVVIDPAYEGHGSDIALFLAERIRETLEEADPACRVYLTRTSGAPADGHLVRLLLTETGASRFLSLSMPEGEAKLSASLDFSETFFIRGYGNAPFASDLSRALSAVDGLSFSGAGTLANDPVLALSKVPACRIRIEGVRSSFGRDLETLQQLAGALSAGLQLSFEEEEP